MYILILLFKTIHKLVNKENFDNIQMHGKNVEKKKKICCYAIMHITLGYQSMQEISATT